MSVLVRRSLAPVVLLVLVGAPAAVAASPPPPISSVAEYVETFPTSAGWTTKTPGARATLTGPVANAILREGGSDRAALSTVVASGPKAARQARSNRRTPAYVVAGTPTLGAAVRSWGNVFGTGALAIVSVLSLATIAFFIARHRRV